MGLIARQSAIGGALTLVMSAAVTAQDDWSPPPGSASSVVPPTEEPLGIPYGEWAARWWQWLLSVPASEGPGTTDNCQANQSGEVFFIPHTSIGTSSTTLCIVDTGQWILASPAGTIWAADAGETDAELAGFVENSRAAFSNLVVTIDGVEVPDIDSYWVVSEGFDLEWIEGNLFEAEADTTTRALAGGWFVMIPPLEVGDHVISVRDDIDLPDDDEGPVTSILTAIVTVVSDEEQDPVSV